VIGLLPGIAGIALFTDSVVAAIRNPGTFSLGVLAVVVTAVVLGSLVLRRWLERRGALHDPR
jgi:hypothetical protein